MRAAANGTAGDARLVAANGRVAHLSLRGKVQAGRFVAGRMRAIAAPLATLWRDPEGGPQQRQLLFGERFLVLEERGDRVFGVARKDGYAGHVARSALGAEVAATHFVRVPATHLRQRPEPTAPESGWLPFGSRVAVVGGRGRFLRLTDGRFVPACHLRPLARPLPDPAAVAEMFTGAPYLWGGNSGRGIDCSGLVQLALLACGIPCPADSDLQEAMPDAAPVVAEALRRGDLLFWTGHVALMLDGRRAVHANAHHMTVISEPLAAIRARISATGGGEPTSLLRPRPALSDARAFPELPWPAPS